jgi:hypothetical protein
MLSHIHSPTLKLYQTFNLSIDIHDLAVALTDLPSRRPLVAATPWREYLLYLDTNELLIGSQMMLTQL